ncbi:hypothetical protein EVAR_64272_1 [Eumeta japonica]|uniref:Uncharacterized protein n=1 Tax=Eumeta variegata TaxID=151549 RepID=A0A4C2A4D8_EUMVA|nr:hypothetical protein EVAR_64272_1 [Eumeta japonica]
MGRLEHATSAPITHGFCESGKISLPQNSGVKLEASDVAFHIAAVHLKASSAQCADTRASFSFDIFIKKKIFVRGTVREKITPVRALVAIACVAFIALHGVAIPYLFFGTLLLSR